MMNKPSELIRLLRPHQWVKNVFVFVGLLFGHAWHDLSLVYSVVAAFIAFSCVASFVYVINDIADRATDRQHPKNRFRPLAAGTVSMGAAIALAAILLVFGLSLGILSSYRVLIFLLIYIVINMLYSFRLKQIVIMDVFIIAAGFMLRIFAGTLGIGIPPSKWLLLCGFMITLFLGLTKRRAEMMSLADNKTAQRKVLAHYTPVLLDKMISITAASVIISYSLYTMSPDTIRIHQTESLIYTVPFVTYGIFRYIFLLHYQQWGGEPSRELA
ncbi:MAG: decaprenyl-phosphate phosphoribosyltransferase, partial [Nitrospirota bacterium]|nr:decaprenyl-phosphate phosphoribosyltransferase [Nitrospirota bacterium]